MKRILLTLTLVLFIAPIAIAQGEQLYANGTATDQNGNTFEWINYSTQDWSIENAEVVTYRDGTEIPQVTDNTWANLTTGAWCYYDNDPTKGKLYNWYAVIGIHDTDPNTPNKEFAPEGWHVPADAEWRTLENYLTANVYNYDGSTTGNKIAKAMASATGWNSSTQAGAIGNNQSLNNSSGFNVFPEGFRNSNGSFLNESGIAIFWNPAQNSTSDAWSQILGNDSSYLDGGINYAKQEGFSVRFVRDASSIGAYGDILLNGTVSAENNQIKNVADPTDAQDTATKSYVDTNTSKTYTQLEVDALIANLQQQIDEPAYTIGYHAELGGYVFMISADGKSGLVAEIEDQGVETWYNAQNLISNPSNHSTVGKNFTDWRLPTRYELAQMYTLKTEIESVGGDLFGSKTYWTSNQSVYSVNGLKEETAWRQNFGTGLQYNSNNVTLDSDLFVRSIREF